MLARFVKNLFDRLVMTHAANYTEEYQLKVITNHDVEVFEATKKDKERGLSYYQDRIDNEHKRYQEYCEKWDKDTANALNEFLEFYAEIYPIIQQNFSSEYSRIKYNVDIDKIIDKLKGMGEII